LVPLYYKANLQKTHAGLVGLAARADAAEDGHELQIKGPKCKYQGPKKYKTRALKVQIKGANQGPKKKVR
jgi:hypothetical protein